MERQGWPALVRCISERDAALVPTLIAGGEDPNGSYAGLSLVALAAYDGSPDALAALIAGGAHVPADALSILGEMDMTDWKIGSAEEELAYARVAEILLAHGASPQVLACDGQPLISTFPANYYPNLHRILSDALSAIDRNA